MLILVFFAFVAGIVTVLSPCILPVLPIILSGGTSTGEQDKNKPYGIIVGFITSFTFFTLFLSTVVKLLGIPSDLLRTFAILVLLLFGISLLIPKFSVYLETLFSKITSKAPNTSTKKGFLGGIIIGLTLGLLWTPCVGPILASVISLALVGEVTFSAVLITLAYALGTAIPMFFIIIGGRAALNKIPILTNNLDLIQKIFGIVMIATAIFIAFDYDRKFQTFILDTFPQYGTGLTKIEELDVVKEKLDTLHNSSSNQLIKQSNTPNNLPQIQKAPELISTGQWLNSEPLTLNELQGKVVLIDFWTYSCINCQRTLPYLRDWWNKYNDEGLVIIGVHSPEFEFEKDIENLQKAVEDFELKYPVMQDNDFKTWRAYSNRYWPAKYLIDANGVVRYFHFGEGDYDETETAIQELLKEANLKQGTDLINNTSYNNYSNTRETYLGYGRIENFGSNENIVKEQKHIYTAPNKLLNNNVAFEGEWLVSQEYSAPSKGAILKINFEAKNVFLVMRPKDNTKNSQVKVNIADAQNYFGADATADGIININEDTLYELVNLQTPSRHILEIEFLDDNIEVYAFTFG